MDNNFYKKKFITLICILLGILGVLALIVIIVDPYFHYHAPLNGVSFELSEERYINDGISRHFDFDGIITGTSMNQNFKTSEAEAYFGGTFVKETYAGASYRELMEALDKSFDRNEKIDKVIWGMDYSGIRRDSTDMTYADIPEFMYDNNPFNDAEYLFNKEIFYKGVIRTLLRSLRHAPSTTFDEYSSWQRETGFDHIMLEYNRMRTRQLTEEKLVVFDYDEELALAKENIENNVIPVIEGHPDVEFYLFFTPYSIIYWDSLYITHTLDIQIDAEKMAAEKLLEYPNVHLFCFYENAELVNNLSLYNNKEHYNADINSWILKCMSDGEYEITKENLDEHIVNTRNYYCTYDYNAMMNSYGYIPEEIEE